MDTVYDYLTQGIVDDNKKGKINDLFPSFIEYFKNKKNIKVFNSPFWRYFCQFNNIIPGKNIELFNPIKMYLSVDRDNIKKVAIKIFDFLEQNNIYHESKIGSEVRSDDIVIRVFSKKDENLIRNFIKNDKEISHCLMKQIPFCFEQDGIGYALDGDLSYNVTISKYIKEYIKKCIFNHQEVSLNDFYRFVEDIYNITFVDKKNIHNFKRDYIDRDDLRCYSEESLLNNYEEITKLILLAIKEDKFDFYLDFVDICNDKTRVAENTKKYVKKDEDSKDLSIKLIYFNKAILETYKKYDIKQVLFAIRKAYIGDFSAFTNNNNARTILINNLKSSDVMKIIRIYSNGDIEKYVNNCLNIIQTNEISDETEKNDLIQKAIYLNKAIITTYEKYNLEQVLVAVKSAFYNNDFGYFTNTYNARDILKENLTSDDVRLIIQNKTNGDIEKYVNELIKSLDLSPGDSVKK